MTDEGEKTEYMLVKALVCNKAEFISTDDTETLSAFRNKHGNRDLAISVWRYSQPNPAVCSTCPLYFCISNYELKKACRSAIEACYYISDNFCIPEDSIDIIYNGGGDIYDRTGETGKIDVKNDSGINKDNIDYPNDIENGNDTGYSHVDDHRGDNHVTGGGEKSTAEMIILIHPVVFGGQPSPLLPVLNYHLALQIANDGIRYLDIDVYEKHLIQLPNSLNSATSRYVIPLSLRELMYLDVSAIANLAKKPRPDDSLVIPHRSAEAAEWFTEILKELTNKQKAQDELLKLTLQDGWQIPPCIQRLLWMDLSKEQAVEACRVISQFYFWIKASPDEVWHHFQRLDRRNRIEDYQRLRAILNFAKETPNFVGCEYPLLKRFCPAGKCFMAELVEECEQPYLFEFT